MCIKKKKCIHFLERQMARSSNHEDLGPPGIKMGTQLSFPILLVQSARVTSAIVRLAQPSLTREKYRGCIRE